MTLNGNKGNAFLDTLWVVLTIFVFGIIIIFGYTLLGEVNDEFQQSDMSDNAKEKLQTLEDGYPVWFDYLFLTAFVLLWIAAILFSFFVDAHPVFLIITLVLLLFVLFLAAVYSNAYEEVMDSDDFDASAFPIINFVLSNLLLVVLGVGFSIAIALYGKNQVGGGGF